MRRARRARYGSGGAFLRRGVPPQYRKYDLGFLRWLAQRGKQPDYLTETDLEVLNGDTLSRLYDLVVFGGHTEYVTPREFDASSATATSAAI